MKIEGRTFRYARAALLGGVVLGLTALRGIFRGNPFSLARREAATRESSEIAELEDISLTRSSDSIVSQNFSTGSSNSFPNVSNVLAS